MSIDLKLSGRNARLKLPCAFKAYAGWTRIPSIKAVTEDQGHLMLEPNRKPAPQGNGLA